MGKNTWGSNSIYMNYSVEHVKKTEGGSSIYMNSSFEH